MIWEPDSINSIKLRKYQVNQLNFIETKFPGHLPMAIESPTGSGKSIMILSFIKNKIEEYAGSDKTIILTTGFNRLVYQMAADAQGMGLEPIVFIGKNSTKCGLKIMENGKLEQFPELDGLAFTDKKEERVSPSRCANCKYKNKCYYGETVRKIKGFGTKFIITNHSSYLLALSSLFDPDIVVVDESHTFAQFYESYLKTELTSKDITLIQNILKEGNSPINSVFKMVVEKGSPLSPRVTSKIKEKIVKSKISSRFILANSLDEIASAKPGVDNYISISNKGFELTKFWDHFHIRQKDIQYILLSATQDEFTLDMFGVMRGRIYRETQCNTIKYSDSEFMIVPEDDFEQGLRRFLKEVSARGLSRGLILSTTTENVNNIVHMGEIDGFMVVTSIKDFEAYQGKCILIGSRIFFQGVDIIGLDFVGLNRIPFPTYDNKYQKQAKYLEDVCGINAWTKFTIPKVKNDLTQSLGRLWRRPGDKGVIAIFDPRLTSKFAYMKNYVLQTRKGIKLVELPIISDTANQKPGL